MRGKYVVISHGLFEAVPILGPELIKHSDLIKRHDVVQSAGFFCIRDNVVSVWGKAVSLKVESKREDKLLIEKMFRDE